MSSCPAVARCCVPSADRQQLHHCHTTTRIPCEMAAHGCQAVAALAAHDTHALKQQNSLCVQQSDTQECSSQTEAPQHTSMRPMSSSPECTTVLHQHQSSRPPASSGVGLPAVSSQHTQQPAVSPPQHHTQGQLLPTPASANVHVASMLDKVLARQPMASVSRALCLGLALGHAVQVL